MFWRYMSIVLLITCIPFALIGVIQYYVVTDRVGDEVNKAHQEQLNLSLEQIEEYMTQLEHSVVQIAFGRTLDESLAAMDFIQQFELTNELLKTFSLITQSNSLIDSVGLYLHKPAIFLGDKAGFRPIETMEDRRLFQSLLSRDRIIYWLYALKKIEQPEALNQAIVIRLPGGQVANSYGAFIIYINQERLNDIVRKLASGDGVAFLANEHGQWLTTTQHSPRQAHAEEGTLEHALQHHIQEHQPPSDKFIYDWNNASYSVTYGTISNFGGSWTVVSATPLAQIIAPINSMSNIIIGLSAAGITLGLLLSWFASNLMYNPIYRLKSLFESSRSGRDEEANEIIFIENRWKQHVQEHEALASKVKQSVPMLRESFLLQFLQGNLYIYNEAEVIDKLGQLEWDIKRKRFVVLAAQLHDVTKLDVHNAERDIQLISFAASNIMTELCSEKLDMLQVMNFQDLSVGALLVFDDLLADEAVTEEVNRLAQNYMDTINNVLRIKVTVVTSGTTGSIMDIPGMMEQTRKALRFRDLHSANQMLDMNHFSLAINRQSTYPSDLEREIIHTISLGLEEEAVRLIRQFIDALQGSGSTELIVHQGMMKLLGGIHGMIVKYEMNMYALYDGAHLYEQLIQLKEPDVIVHWFQLSVIRPLVQALRVNYDADTIAMIESLVTRIHEEITEEISLELYAAQLNLSASRLSRMFKQSVGVGFIDYISRLRIEKCKELLCTTDLTVNEIAGMLHYQPSYLIRVFKKSEGITPGKYREKHT